MRAFLEGHMQLSAEDTAASKKLCAAVSCPVLKSCMFAAETSEALATKTAANINVKHNPITHKSYNGISQDNYFERLGERNKRTLRRPQIPG